MGSCNRLRRIYDRMRSRCYNPAASKYEYYGGKGITICEEWRQSFQAFEAWALAHGYADTLTIDRKDGNGPYSPSNCRWATWKEQGRNRSNNHLLTYDGQTMPIAEFAERYGIPEKALYKRIERGWGAERALTTPVRPHKRRKEERRERIA